MNRRQFLLHTAALAATTHSAFAADGRRRLTVGLLGAAHSHAAEKFRILSQSPDYEFIGISEGDPGVRSAFGKAGAKFVPVEELLSRAEVVVVESVVRHHARDAKRALEAGCHVHVEKPPAATLRELRELLDLAAKHQRLLQIGYMWRFHPGFHRAFDAMRRGCLGEVYMVRATMNTLIDARRRPEWGEFKGGAMFELGCHLIDAVVRALGRPKKITPLLQRRGGDDLADNCVAVFEYPKAQAIITTAVLQPNAGPQRFLEILGTNGSARVQPIEPPSLTIDLARDAAPYQAGPQKIELPAYRRYVDEFIELAAAIREQRPLGVSAETELLLQETLLRACEMA